MKTTDQREGLFRERELMELISRFVEGVPDGIGSEELDRLLGWAEEARFNESLLTLVQRGEVRVRWPDGEDDLMLQKVTNGGAR